MITVTTVGYGDVSPETAAGKIVAAITALFGIAVIAIPIGIVSFWLYRFFEFGKSEFRFQEWLRPLLMSFSNREGLWGGL